MDRNEASANRHWRTDPSNATASISLVVMVKIEKQAILRV